MSKKQTKSHQELTAFDLFLGEIGCREEGVRLESREPPEPDILYRHPTEGCVAFELVELCSNEMARALSTMDLAKPLIVRAKGPSYAAIKGKFRKNYESKHPIELLCYRGRSVFDDADICHSVEDLVAEYRHQFRRIWIWGDAVWVHQQGFTRRFYTATAHPLTRFA